MKEESLGFLWHPATAKTAFKKGKIKSNHGGSKVRLCVRNHLDAPLIFCWVDGAGAAHHFRQIRPCGGVEECITKADFTEKTMTGHSFLFATGSFGACQRASDTKTFVNGVDIIGGYRPESIANGIHLVSIDISDEGGVEPSLWCCIGPHLRGSKKPRADENPRFVLTVQPASFDSTPIDTTKKVYISDTIGGWPVRLERNWHGGDVVLRDKIERDLLHATKCLPRHAYETLIRTTPIWINNTLEYGPEACPLIGVGLCFHPGEDWLADNGCHREKCHAVELYCVDYYKKTADHWGTGGVLLHELSHAYHCLCLPDGYENNDIKECFQAAMKDGLYECVPVHGPQGPVAKAYACTDQMEYWAELSAAFLGGVNPDHEYNKWFPFNRTQVKKHDPRAYELLRRLWRVNYK